VVVLATTIDPIYQPSLEFHSRGGGEVYTVGNGEELSRKTAEEIPCEAEEEIAHAACLARETDKVKQHNSLQDDLGTSDEEPRDGTSTRRHHSMLNSWCQANRVRLWNRS
jgi:hypothetical protein